MILICTYELIFYTERKIYIIWYLPVYQWPTVYKTRQYATQHTYNIQYLTIYAIKLKFSLFGNKEMND